MTVATGREREGRRRGWLNRGCKGRRACRRCTNGEQTRAYTKEGTDGLIW